MKHLLNVIGQHLFATDFLISLCNCAAGAFGRYVQHQLADLDLWKGPYGQVKQRLRSGLMICERWISACQTLTSQFWKRYGPNPWKGDKCTPEGMVQLAQRLEEVHQLLVRLFLSRILFLRSSLWDLCMSSLFVYSTTKTSRILAWSRRLPLSVVFCLCSIIRTRSLCGTLLLRSMIGRWPRQKNASQINCGISSMLWKEILNKWGNFA